MKIIIPSIHVPFVFGGGEMHIQNLKMALEKFGHEVEIVTFPFKFCPDKYIEDLMDYCAHQDFNDFCGHKIDKVISLQFPAYYIQHDNKSLWIMHQYRGVYDLYDTSITGGSFKHLKEKIEQMDNAILSKEKNIYANSQNIANRLKRYNGIDATPLYHPPHNETAFFCSEDQAFIFYPSRLESLKRQDLLIKAMQYTKSKAVAIISGKGLQYENYRELIQNLGVEGKVSLAGYISEEEKINYYANCLAVFFAPVDEDYGYITLEAMLSSKPVITCSDSGGPLEFVRDGETGFVVEPDPREIAEKIDWLYDNRKRAGEFGKNGLQAYLDKNISWDNVVEKLLAQ